MTTPILIGLAGPAGAGKTTAAQRIAQITGMHALSFADPVKDMAAAALGCDRQTFQQEHWDNRSLREVPINGIGHTPRAMVQTLGTEWGRELMGEQFWVRLAAMRIGDLEDQAAEGGEPFLGAVFDDVRFENEAAFIRAHGGTVVHLYRRQASKVRPHASEAGIKVLKTDHGIWNTGDMDNFRADIEGLVELIQREQAGRAA